MLWRAASTTMLLSWWHCKSGEIPDQGMLEWPPQELPVSSARCGTWYRHTPLSEEGCGPLSGLGEWRYLNFNSYLTYLIYLLHRYSLFSYFSLIHPIHLISLLLWYFPSFLPCPLDQSWIFLMFLLESLEKLTSRCYTSKRFYYFWNSSILFCGVTPEISHWFKSLIDSSFFNQDSQWDFFQFYNILRPGLTFHIIFHLQEIFIYIDSLCCEHMI